MYVNKYEEVYMKYCLSYQLAHQNVVIHSETIPVDTLANSVIVRRKSAGEINILLMQYFSTYLNRVEEGVIMKC